MQIKHSTLALWRPAFVLLLSLSVVACTPCVVQGIVSDAKGEPLPGVAVKVEDGNETLTDAVGAYRIGVKQGTIHLSCIKTGFTAGHFSAELSGNEMDVPPIILWRLPQTSGLFFLENHTYRETTHAEPVPVTIDQKTVLYAVRPADIAKTDNAMPTLVCFQVPPIDAELCGVKTIQAATLDAVTMPRDVWVRDKVIPARLAPVDEPERCLWQVQLFDPLEPGIYCLHWGALLGHNSTDPRLYIFEVLSPESAANNQ